MRYPITILAVLMFASAASAGDVNRFSGLSTEYSTNPNRYATTDLDAGFYNPAGLAFGREGLGFNVLNQATWGLESFIQEERESHDSRWAPLCPMLMASYRKDDWTFYLASGLLGGGGVQLEGDHPAIYENKPYIVDEANETVSEMFGGGGSSDDGEQNIVDARFDNSTMDATTFFAGGYAGVAYRINDAIAVSAGGKYVYHWGSLAIGTDFELYIKDCCWTEHPDFERLELQARSSGHGFGLTAGVHLNPMRGLHIGIRGETSTRIEVTSIQEKDNMDVIEDESVSRNDIPGTASIGVAYDIIPELQFTGSFAWHFNKQGSYGELLGFDITGKLNDGWEVGGGFEYRPIHALQLRAGYLRGITGFTDETRTSARFKLDSHYINAGATYSLTDDLAMTGAFMAMIYDPGKDRTGETVLEPMALVFGLGFEFWL